MRSFVPDRDTELVFALVGGSMGEPEFRRSFPGDPRERVVQWLERSLRDHDSLGVEVALSLGHRFGFPQESLPILLVLATAEWHQRHEDVVGALSKFHTEESVVPLFQAATLHLAYRDYDEFNSLGVKCVFALERVGSVGAVDRLADLARSGDAILEEAARASLLRLASESDSPEIRRAARMACRTTTPRGEV